jgi:hypothetical protein
MENKQTAVEWLVEQIENKYLKTTGAYDVKVIIGKAIIDQDKAMERDQIEQAHEDAFISMNMAFRAAHRAEAYYDETYNAQK